MAKKLDQLKNASFQIKKTLNGMWNKHRKKIYQTVTNPNKIARISGQSPECSDCPSIHIE